MKSRDEVLDEVKTLIAETFALDPETLAPENKIAELSKDSIQLFELLLAFEKHYEMETTYDDVVRLHTIDDIVEYLMRVKYGT